MKVPRRPLLQGLGQRPLAGPIACASAVLVLLAPACAAAARHGPPSCPRRGVRILARDLQAELFLLPESEVVGPQIAGCAYARGRTVIFGRPFTGTAAASGGISFEVLAGHMAAFEAGRTTGYTEEEGGDTGRLVVVNLLNAKTVHRVPDGYAGREDANHVGAPGHVEQILLKPDGSAAWTVATDPQFGTYQLLAVDSSGWRLLAQGANIAPHSLAAVGDTLYWTAGGVAELAELH